MSWSEKDSKGGSNSLNQYSEALRNEEGISSIISDRQQQQLPSLYHGAWPMERELWSSLQFRQNFDDNSVIVASVISFKSNTSIGVNIRDNESPSEKNHDPKIDVIYSLLGMLLGDTVGREDTSNTLLSLSNTVENCLAMRQSGCLPLLVQLIHSPEHNLLVRRGASQALNNIVRATQDEKLDYQELQVLKLIEQLRDCSQLLRTGNVETKETCDRHRHSISTMFVLTKLSYTESYRHIMCQLGSLHAIAELIEMDHLVHGSNTNDSDCLSLRKYTGMTLTNLTYGDSKNKSILCSFSEFIKVWVAQLQSVNEDLHQYTASVLRNLSWRADSNSKRILREMGSVVSLTKAAMASRHELTLKSILSALWNLSAHCTTNKADICNVDGALSFLVDLLSFKSPSNKLAIVENAGGILRNVSSHVAMEESYRKILRDKNSINILVGLLSSPSLTVVSNACGTLWNLSARCPKDQKTLWELGTVPILRNLVHSKHKMISMGASATLRNLLVARSVHGFQLTQSSFQRLFYIPTSRTEIARLRNHSETRSLLLGASYRSRSVEIELEEQEKRPLSSKSWPASLSRHPTSPLSCDDNVRNVVGNDKPIERRKGSLVDSTFFDRRCLENVSYEEGDQPIDYSKKYMEQGNIKQEESLKIKSRREKFREGSSIFGDYAETDLDQPTDYSLRYAEDDTDDEDEQNDNYYQVNEQEDTVKTYYTEGTPYETPCNFSTATSMSDLRLEESKEPEINSKIRKKAIKETIKEHKEIKHFDEQHILTNKSHLRKNSPAEKNDYYYEQGTPGIVSRVNSLSSLELASQNDDNRNTREVEKFEKKPKSDGNNTEIASDTVEDKGNKIFEEKNLDKETKVVTFGGEDHYTEETPLMFSRSSSLGSLSGFEQYSINDDRSSVISDFSRRTSGVVSPSELPDSPTQTVPPSPRHSDKSMDFLPRGTEERCLSHFSKFPYQKTKNSVFEDNTAAFKEESTPIEFSAATSLSSLTIDDDSKFLEESNNEELSLKNSKKIEEAEVQHPVVVSLAASSEEISHTKETINNDRDNEQVSDGDEEDEDEDILAACINMGMQNNRYRQSVKKIEFKSFSLTSVSNLIRYQTSSTLDRLENISTSEIEQSNLSPITSKTTLDISTSPDTVHVYCTEDTPANISPVGSQSNLSALSMPSILEDFDKPENLDNTQNDLSDDSSNLSGDDEQILDECIQSGMPKRVSPMSLVCKKSSQVFLSRTTEFSQSSDSLATRNSCECLVRAVDGRDDDSNNSFDDSPNHSDDDAILAECIESAMPKGRLNPSIKASTSRQSDKFNEHFKASGGEELKSPKSEDSLSLSEDEENMILAQCIQSGMPKGSNSTKMFSTLPKEDFRLLYSTSTSANCSPCHMTQQKKALDSIAVSDETWNFATEDTPCNFFIISEINDLTLNST